MRVRVRRNKWVEKERGLSERMDGHGRHSVEVEDRWWTRGRDEISWQIGKAPTQTA